MKYYIYFFVFFLAFFFQKINAQDYQFLSGKSGIDGSAGIMVNKDSMVFWPIGNANDQSDFDIRVLNKNKYIANCRYRYSKNKNAYIGFFNSLILNDTTIVLVGASNIVDTQYGNKCIVILDACLKPKKFYLFDEKSYGSILGLMEIDDKTVLLNMGEADHENISVFIPFDIEKEELLTQKFVTFRANYGNSILINDDVFYFGANYRDKDSTKGQSLKAQLAKFDTSGNLFWEKIYILDEPKQFYDGRDFVQINDNPDFLLFMFDYQTNKKNPNESGGIRVIKTDSAFNIKWTKLISDTNDVEMVLRAAKLNNNRYVVLGARYPLKKSFDIQCAKLYLIDSNANIINSYLFPCGSSSTFRSFFRFFTLDAEGDLLISGNYIDGGNVSDAYLVKLKPDLSIAQQMPDNRIYKNACGEIWKDTTYELPEPIIIPINLDSFPRSIAPVYSVGPGTTASIEKTKTGAAKAIIYPNPTSDFLEFYSQDFIQLNQISFEIYNSIGQLMLSQSQLPIVNGKFSINVQELPAGNYHLKVSGNENVVNFKFVVE